MEKEFEYLKEGTNERREIEVLKRHSMKILKTNRNNSWKEKHNEVSDEEIW
jgi:hypothetical protein